MFELRKVYTRVILGGIFLSQVIPTFGAYLGFAGNWIPYMAGFGITSLGVLLYLFEERAIQDRITRYAFFLYWVVAIVHTLSLMLIFSDLSRISEYADLFRWITIPVFILAGVAFAKKSSRPLRSIYILNVVLLVFTVLLFVDFVRDNWSSAQKLYATHTHGFGRYAGNWNYPYNLSVALFFYILVLSVGWQKMQSLMGGFLSAFGILICLLLILVGQSRGSLAALFGATAIVFVYRLSRMFMTRRIKLQGKTIFPVLSVLSIFPIVIFSIDETIVDIIRRFGGRYFQFTSAASALESSGRGEELNQMIEYLSDYPINLITGFGPLRDVDFWVQNLLLYLLRYGVLGLVLYVFLVPGATIFSVYLSSKSRMLKRVILAYSAWIIFVLLNSVSHDIFSHFRFIPLFYFVTGIILGSRHRSEM